MNTGDACLVLVVKLSFLGVIHQSLHLSNKSVMGPGQLPKTGFIANLENLENLEFALNLQNLEKNLEIGYETLKIIEFWRQNFNSLLFYYSNYTFCCNCVKMLKTLLRLGMLQ